MVALPESVLRQYATISLYNSPYPAHETGRAIDLYPEARRRARASSPVAGTVIETRAVETPSRTYAAPRDYLLVVDTGQRLARILHVEPVVEAGERVEAGDSLGTTVRSGYFDPWVADHLHLGFRPQDADPARASGSLPIELDVSIDAVAWDGTGTVRRREPTFTLLDSPSHPAPGERFAGIATDRGALDGGLPHYPGGGVFGGPEDGESDPTGHESPIEFAGERVGVARGRTVEWADVAVLANGEPVKGISLALWRDRVRVKLVGELDVDHGERVAVTVRR